MKLTVLGKFGPFAPEGGATSGYLLQTEKSNVLLDLGSGVLARYKKYKKVEDLSFLILSHLHFDHTADVGVLSYALAFSGKKEKLNVYLPNFDCPLLETIKSIKEFNLIFIEEGKVYRENDLEFSFYKMTHPVLSFGVKIKSDRAVFAYTGDTTENENLKELVKNSNLSLCDGAFIESDYQQGKPHMCIKQACALSNYFYGKVIVTHLNEKYTSKQLQEEIREFKNAEIAVEGKTYDI